MAEKDYEQTKLDPWMILFFVTPSATMFCGLVIYKLWGWFVVPALHWSAITWAQAMGLGVLHSCFSASPSAIRRQMSWYELLAASLVVDAIALLMGYIVHAAST